MLFTQEFKNALIGRDTFSLIIFISDLSLSLSPCVCVCVCVTLGFQTIDDPFYSFTSFLFTLF